MAKKNKDVEVEVKGDLPNPYGNANDVLNSMKDKFPLVVVIGIKPDGNIDINANNAQYQTLQWALARAAFELNIHEKSNLVEKNDQH